MDDMTKSFIVGVVCFGMLLTFPVLFLIHHTNETAYERGQRDAILGNIKYEMTIIPAVTPSPDTIWIRKEK